ncbi:hypothetical protein [Acinetobacter baumannii]|uniref:hypothetical protein n=1 Tax=Acinetobacter baumannii TaxID=470 RepID=UPI0018FF7CC7|nr:hypothetical protein [Acinetobacter baumannii]MBJ9490064.1 hypothetical protein [Acinetobacter baumannii]
MREDQAGILNQLLSSLDAIPEEIIALTAYGVLVVFAILVTPTVSEGPNASVAPAIFGLLFGVLTKDSPLIWSNLSLILFVIGLGLVIGYCWSKYITNKSMRSI